MHRQVSSIKHIQAWATVWHELKRTSMHMQMDLLLLFIGFLVELLCHTVDTRIQTGDRGRTNKGKQKKKKKGEKLSLSGKLGFFPSGDQPPLSFSLSTMIPGCWPVHATPAAASETRPQPTRHCNGRDSGLDYTHHFTTRTLPLPYGRRTPSR